MAPGAFARTAIGAPPSSDDATATVPSGVVPVAPPPRRAMPVTGRDLPSGSARLRTAPSSTSGGGPLPELVGRYVIEAELGRGGMGVVYRARDPELQRTVAIKMILDVERAGPTGVERFQREARAAALLRHPGIVSLLEVGEHAGKPYLVMDYVEGRPLDEAHGEERSISPRRMAEILLGLCLALDHAHENGVVHRDVKPQNVIIDGRGEPHLVDFGLAMLADGDESDLTKTGQMMGTPNYVAPEQAAGKKEDVGPRADVHSVGAVLYWALTGHPPYEGNTVLEVMTKIFTVDPVPPRRLDPSVHPDLETIALRCLEKKPERRFASARALADELRRFLDGEAILARPLSRSERARRWARRHPARVVAIILGALLAIGLPAALGAQAWRASAAREAAAADARSEITDLARASSDAAWDAFERVRASAPTVAGEEGRRLRSDALLAAALEAFGSAHRYAGVAPTDPAAAEALFRAAMALGEVGLEAEQWTVAASAFGRAATLGVDDAAAAEAAASVDGARERVAREHRATVEAAIADVRSGDALRRARGYEEALFAIVRYPETQTVSILTAELDAISEALRAATRTLYLEAGTPTADEARAGVRPIAGLAEALDRLLARRPGETPSPDDAVILADAEERIEARIARERGRFSARHHAPGFRYVLGSAQEQRIGPTAAVLARLCAEALGWIGIREGAVDALAGYLAAEADVLRAVPAGIALCQLGGERARSLVAAAIRADDSVHGIFRSRVSPILGEVEVDETLLAETAAGHTARGIARRENDRLDEAIADFDRAIELDPKHVEAWDERGMTRQQRLAEGDVEGAIADARRATELDPSRAMSWYHLALAIFDTDDQDAVRAALDQAIAADPRMAKAYKVRGIVRGAQGDIDGSLEDVDRALAIDPRFPAALKDRAHLLLQKGEHDRAVADLDRAIALDPTDSSAWANRAYVRWSAGRVDAAVADATRAIELDPSRSRNWRTRAMARQQKGDLAGALADLDRAVEVDPEDASAFSRRGNLLHQMGELERALADLDRAIELDPKNGSAWAHRGMLRKDARDFAGAEADFTQALRVSPNLHYAVNARGLVRLDAGNLQGALVDLSRAIELRPRSAPGWTNRALVRRRIGDHEGAIADVTRAIELEPRDARLWANRGGFRSERNDIDGAIEDFTQAIEIEPRLTGAWLNRAIMLERKGDLPAAIADLGQAVKLEPSTASIWRTRGGVRRKAGDRVGALADVDRALQLQPNLADAWLERGGIKDEMGDQAGAIADYGRFLELVPKDHARAAAARRRIAILEKE